MFNMVIVLVFSLLLNSCSQLINLDQREQEDFVEIFCQKGCKTIVAEDVQLSALAKKKIRSHLAYFSHKKPIIVAACSDNLVSKKLALSVVNYIKLNNRSAVVVRPIYPYSRVVKDKPCVSLIKGKLKFKLPDCDDVSNYKNNLLVGYKFGCSTQYNLLQMLKDPNDLLSLADFHNVD